MQIIAQGWLVYEISDSELALGLVGFASAIPALLISPWAGVIVDRVAKRKVLVFTQSVAMLLAFVLSALVFADLAQVWQVVVLAACLGAVNALDGPARQAFVVEMVGRDDLPNAIALNSMAFNLARVVGPAFGGAILVAVGAGWCFFLNGLSFIAVIFGLLLMRIPPHVNTSKRESPMHQLRTGLDYSWRTPSLRALLLLAFAFSMFGIAYSTVMPAFVDEQLNQGAGAFAVINMVTGVGAFIGAFTIAQYGDRNQRGRWLTFAILTFPLVLTLFALNTNYAVSAALSLALGILFMLVFTLLNTLLQTQVRDDMRGRVLSLYTLTFFGFTPFGNLMIGALSESIGLSKAIVISAGLCFAIVAVVLALTPQVRSLP